MNIAFDALIVKLKFLLRWHPLQNEHLHSPKSCHASNRTASRRTIKHCKKIYFRINCENFTNFRRKFGQRQTIKISTEKSYNFRESNSISNEEREYNFMHKRSITPSTTILRNSIFDRAKKRRSS